MRTTALVLFMGVGAAAPAAQVTIDGSVDCMVRNPLQILQTTVPPGTTQTSIVHHLRTATEVGEAVCIMSTDHMFLCVAGFVTGSSCFGNFTGSGDVVLWLHNTSTGPLTLAATGFVVATPRAMGTLFFTNGPSFLQYQSPGSFDFLATVPVGGTAYIDVNASATTGCGSSAGQVVVDVAIRSSSCSQQAVTTTATGVVPGEGGLPPMVSLRGCLLGGVGSIDLNLARPSSPSVLLVGAPGAGVPILGGIVWPAGPVAIPVVTGPAVMGFGGWSLPVSVPVGTMGSAMLQGLVADPAAVQGVAISNALTVTFR